VIRVFVFFVLLGLAMAGVVWVADRPGAVTVVWEDWRLDTSLGVLLIAVSVVAVVAALLFMFLR
jgi:HemY protein